MDQPPTRNKDPRTNNPLNKTAGIKALSSKASQRRYRSGGIFDALRPEDLNRPGIIRESKGTKTPKPPETKNHQ
ncbi:hypothetical protein A2U01_0045401 [Trifolium medium]|uniref:Uncharacterized protein n=1 Tax=Trifolium medium TaxID=97028 RepID=A0A392QJ48_9FABA|nr:hypothetical protein [Trifolium medium]